MRNILLTASVVSALLLNGCVAPSDVKPQNASAMSTYQLCEDYSSRKIMYGNNTKSPNIINELKKRKAFSSKEWELIREEKISVGMSRLSLICSWGKPDRIHRSSYSDAQYVFTHQGRSYGQYVYINESTDKVSAWN